MIKNCWIGFALTFLCFPVLAEPPQPLPQNTDLKLHIKHVILSEVRALQFREDNGHHGVVATYDCIYTLSLRNKKVTSGKKLGVWDPGSWDFKRNETSERIFIVGLDHNIITTDGIIYHEKSHLGDQHFLALWPIGTEYLSQNQRLKKFTVRPKEAFGFYKKNSQK